MSGAPTSTPSEREDALYLKLHGARESLCLAQMHCIDPVDTAALGKAVDAIDFVGSQLPQWSRFDRPPAVPASSEVASADDPGGSSTEGEQR